jgi:hypothetical protein
MRIQLVTIVVLLTIILLSSCYFQKPAYAYSAWNNYLIDDNGAGYGNGLGAIAIDPQNIVYLTYSEFNSSGIDSYPIVYTSVNGSNLDINKVIGGGESYGLLFDKRGGLHILCDAVSETTHGLIYASLKGSNWTIQIIDPYFSYGFATFSLDALDNPHITYSFNDTLNYASCVGSSWVIETIDKLPQYTLSLRNFSPYLVLSNNSVFILYNYPAKYQNSDENSLKIAMITPSMINYKILIENVSDYGNLAVDSYGRPHFVFSNNSRIENNTINSSLFYESWTGTTWVAQEIFSSIPLYSCGSLAFDKEDYPHLVYIIHQKAPLIYATSLIYSSWTGDSWTAETVDSTSSPSESCYLLIDGSLQPHIMYRGNVNGVHASIYYSTESGKSNQVSSSLFLLSGFVLVSVIIVLIIVLLLKKRRINRAKFHSFYY